MRLPEEGRDINDVQTQRLHSASEVVDCDVTGSNEACA